MTEVSVLTKITLTLFACFLVALVLVIFWAAARQRRLMREVRRRDALFSAFFDASPAGLAILDRDMKYVRVNATRAFLAGSLTDVMQGQRPSDLSQLPAGQSIVTMSDVLIYGTPATNIDLEKCGPKHDQHWLVSWFPLYGVPERAPSGLGEVVLDITDRRRAELELTHSQEKLRRLAAHRENQREAEYRRLAREFHDELGQILTSARLHVQRLTNELPTSSHDQLAELDDLISDAYRSVKQVTSELRPAVLNMGLASAIEWQTARSLAPAKIKCTLLISEGLDILDDATSTTLFRIVQESCTNVVRYANAQAVHVSLRNEGALLALTIADDGHGFDPDSIDATSHFGLAGMAERVDALGGTIEIESTYGEGTCIRVRVPISGNINNP